MNSLLMALFRICVSTMIFIFKGFVFSVIWGWFVAATIGVGAISVPVALGIIILVKLVTSSPEVLSQKEIENRAKDWGQVMGINIITCLLILVAGWVVKMFI